MLDDLLEALANLADYDLEDLLEEILPEELRDLCKYKRLIRLLLDLCPEK